jgi:hypothetical protein
MSDDSRIVQVGVAPNEAIGLWWKEILEGEGVKVVLRPGGIGYGYFSNALNEHYLLVLEEQSALALEILDDIVKEDAEDFDEI